MLLGPGLAALVALAILVSLGMWQLERLTWKEALIARIAARVHAEPVALPSEAHWEEWRGDDGAFRRVRLSGMFLHDREVLVHGLMAAQRGAPVQGFYVFAPLRLADGASVFVNRGFVPTELKDPERRREGNRPGTVAVTGLVRTPEARSWFVPVNDAARSQWFVRDPGEMAHAQGLSRVAPFYVDADGSPNPGGWPKGGQTNLALPNNHRQYALTWFGLALTLTGVFAAWAWGRLRIVQPQRCAGAVVRSD
jgi:surfeit locus 1 family protein